MSWLPLTGLGVTSMSLGDWAGVLAKVPVCTKQFSLLSMFRALPD